MDAINSLLDFSKICRLCLSQDLSLIKIFTDNDHVDLQASISSKIKACLSIEVELGDNLPDKICIECVEQIENWERFKALCDNATSLLLQYASGISPISNEVLQKNLQECNSESLDLPNTPDFCFENVSLLDHDSLLEKIEGTDEENGLKTDPEFHNSFSMILDKSNKNGKKCIKQVDTIEKFEENNISPLTPIHGNEKIQATEKPKRRRTKKYGRKYYDCEFCSEVFTKFAKLLEHDRLEHKDVNCKEVCPLCSQIFISKYRLEVHNDMRHREKLYSCDICGLSSVSKKSLTVHILKHSDRFVCKVCGVAKSTARTLEDHVRSHSDDKLYKCEMCQRSFKQQQSLEHHLKTHNPQLLPEYQCNICSKTFKSVSFLNIHKTTHENENLSMCEICGKSFKNRNTLFIHKLNHEEKKHGCLVCDKMFTTKNLLSRHLQRHLPGKFVCPVCGKSYSRSDTFKMHMKSHKKES